MGFISINRTCTIFLFITFAFYFVKPLMSENNNWRHGLPIRGSNSEPYRYRHFERRSPYESYRPWNPGQEHVKIPETGLKSEYGDSRCIVDGYYNDSLKGLITVSTNLGSVEGTYVFLCDAPGVPDYERPKKTDTRNPHHKPVKIHKSVAIFLGIPYAKPPTQDLRFKPPQFLPNFNIIRALKYKDSCPQDVMYYGESKGIPDTNEDCLYLNIFTPSVEKRNELYPVMIYIHGGSWSHGSANIFPAQMLAASQEVVVVTFNYRLGPLGFFATGDKSSPGNYGLLDQAMAIDWVRDNIEAFNGNPKLITLFGPGTGAASAGIHMLSPRLQEESGVLRVIAQSGSAVADWASTADPTVIRNNSVEFAKIMRCNFQSTERIVDCLRDRDSTSFQMSHLQLKPKAGWLPWLPVVDGFTREYGKQILPASPEIMLKQMNSFIISDYMAGVTKDDALNMVWKDHRIESNNYHTVRDLFMEKIHQFPSIYNYSLDPESLIKAIEFYYVPCDKKSENITYLRQSLIDMLSDSFFNSPNDKMLKLLLSKGIKTYMYVLSTTAEGIKKAKDLGIFNESVPHDSEYYFITGAPFMDPKLYPKELQLSSIDWTAADRNMSQFFMTSWANFAKFGNPTPTVILDSIQWNQTGLQQMQYLYVNSTNFTSVMKSSYRQKESQFWNEYIPSLMQLVLPTWPPTYQPWEIQRNVYEASLWGVLAATVLFITLSLFCCCLYYRAKSKHMVSTEDIPDAISTTPSSVDTLLNLKKIDRNKYLSQRMEMEQKHTQV